MKRPSSLSLSRGKRPILAARLGGFITRHPQNVAGLTFECPTNRFEGIKRNALSFVFFQTPKRCVTNSGLFGQPVKRPAARLEQVIDLNSDHCTFSISACSIHVC